MRYLSVISLLIVFASCGKPIYSELQNSSADKSCISKLKPSFTKVLYNTKIDVIGKHLSGLLLFKTMPDSSIRVLFSNEMGVKFFDFEYHNSEFKKIYAIKQLDKKLVIKQLKEDIGYLIMYKIDPATAEVKQNDNKNYFIFPQHKTSTYYITDSNCTKLLSIENNTKRNKKIIIDLNEYKSGLPDSVNIAHQFFQFNISLKQIEQ